jgi:hypothetical protein
VLLKAIGSLESKLAIRQLYSDSETLQY